MFWSARAVTEWTIAPMTLFGTLTLRPEKDVEVDALARVHLAERGVDFDRDLSRDEQFRARVKFAGLELTKFLKDRKSTRLNSSHRSLSRMPSSA